MLGAHPELAIPPESHFLGYLGHRYGRRGWSASAVSAVAADVARDAHFRNWGLDPGSAAAGVVASQPGSLAETLGGFFSAYAASEGKRLWGDKTPHYVFILDQLRELWPDLRVIHVIRDGRDVACSHLALAADGQRWVAPTAAAAAAWWRSAVARGRAAGGELGDRYTEVRYEQLVLRPQQTISRLCEFIGIARDTTVVDYHGRVRLTQSDEFSRVREPLDPQCPRLASRTHRRRRCRVRGGRGQAARRLRLPARESPDRQAESGDVERPGPRLPRSPGHAPGSPPGRAPPRARGHAPMGAAPVRPLTWPCLSRTRPSPVVPSWCWRPTCGGGRVSTRCWCWPTASAPTCSPMPAPA